jgi:NAD(P)-dependent dehydrogenase (short-subunit alcohol dehydrogenase family)
MRKSPTSSIPARRIFLKRTASLVAGASTATLLPGVGSAITREVSSTDLRTCADVKAPMNEVDGKVAFITGGSSGIGLGIARAFIDAGMRVVIGYRTEKHLDDALRYLERAGDRVHAINVDVTDRPGMEKAAEETLKVFGKVHVLVNNAGVVVPSSLRDTTYDDWDWVVNVNLNGVFNGIRTFLPRMLAHTEGGQVITTSSVFGLVAASSLGGYSASKFGAVGLMEALRADLTNTNVGVSVYCPGPVIPNMADANRNRPGALADTGFKPTEEMIKKERDARNDPKMQMILLEAGRSVLRGMRNNDLYILTHPEYEQILRDRNEALIASLPRDLNAPQERDASARTPQRESIYVTARNHQICDQSTRASK